MNKLRSLAAGGLVALAIAGTAAVSTTPAYACWGRWCGPGWGPGWGWGGVAAGAVGGFALGALAAGAATAPPPPPPGYYGPPPGGCYYVRRPVYDQWGNYAGTRPMQVCN